MGNLNYINGDFSIIVANKNSTIKIHLAIFLSIIGLTFCIPKQSVQEIRGHIIYIESNSLKNVSELQIQKENEEIIILKPQIYKGFTPSHLRHHQITSQPLTIRYTINNGILTIISMND